MNRTLAGLLYAIHLFPNIVVGAATLVLELIATRGQLDVWSGGRVWLVVMSGHAAIGLLNDYLDRAQDAISQPTKPIPRGLVSATVVKKLTLILLLLCVGLALTLAPGALLLAIVALTSGLLYDLRWRATYLSWLPYFISFSTFPLFIWAALGKFQPLLLWLYPPAFLISLALNLANTLPDLEADKTFHATKGLAHRLGLWLTLVSCWLLPALTALLCIILSLALPVNRVFVWIGSGLTFLIISSSVLFFWLASNKPGHIQTYTLIWKLTALAVLCSGLGWLSALTLIE